MRTHRISSANDGQKGIDGSAIIWGFGITFGLTVIGAIFLTLLVYFTAASESLVVSITYYVTMLCAAIGSAVAARIAGHLGWLHGAIVGFLFALGSLSASYAATSGTMTMFEMFTLVAASCAVGCLGGIIGVNV